MNEKIISQSDPVGSETLQLFSTTSRFNSWMYSTFKHALKGKILETGSGIGNISQIVLNDGLRLSLSEYNNEYFEWLKNKYGNHPEVEGIFQIDLAAPSFETVYAALKEKFNTIFLLNVIEHIADDNKAVANCQFMLKPGGNLILLAPASPWLFCRLDKELGHYRRYTTRSFKKLLEDGHFDIISIVHFNFLGWWGWLLSGKILKHKALGGSELGLFDKLVPLARLLDKIFFRQIGLSIVAIGSKKTEE